MSDDPPGDDRTSQGNKTCWVSHRLVTGPDRWLLVICADETINTFELPGGETITIGRAPSNHVCIEHASISRTHAQLTLGDEIKVVDQGSTNGTAVAGTQIAPHVSVRVNLGEPIAVGSVMLMLQRLRTQLPRSVLTHEYFEARLEEECAKRARRGGAFAVLRVNTGRAIAAEKREAILHRAVRAQDVIAQYASGEYEILVDAEVGGVEKVKARIEQLFEAEGIRTRIGAAYYPEHGTTPDDLISCATAAVRGVRLEGEAATEVPSSWMAGLRELVTRVAQSELSVLILGETGAGKERMAEAVHELSRRAGKTFLRLNCAALSESLVESELFGHERGAFTGALASKEGLLESAQGGTLFLDEVGELPLSVQVKLLRVLEERKIMRVGGRVARPIDVRFVAATNRDLDDELARGTFRQDLFFRLNGVTLVVPPLRERREEIPRLARMFAAASAPGSVPEFTAEVLNCFDAYDWPGNIRELRNVVERAMLLSDGGHITLQHLPIERIRVTRAARLELPAAELAPARLQASKRVVSSSAFPIDAAAVTGTWPAVGPESIPPAGSTPTLPPASLRDEIDALERERILDALEHSAGNQTKAARMLGMSRGTLVARLDQYDIPRPRKS